MTLVQCYCLGTCYCYKALEITSGIHSTVYESVLF